MGLEEDENVSCVLKHGGCECSLSEVVARDWLGKSSFLFKQNANIERESVYQTCDHDSRERVTKDGMKLCYYIV